jgi:hypothetical protein
MCNDHRLLHIARHAETAGAVHSPRAAEIRLGFHGYNTGSYHGHHHYENGRYSFHLGYLKVFRTGLRSAQANIEFDNGIIPAVFAGFLDGADQFTMLDQPVAPKVLIRIA